MAPGISLRFLRRSGHSCSPQLEVFWTGRRRGQGLNRLIQNQTLRHRIIMTSYSLSRSGSDPPPLFKLCVGVPVLSTCHLVCVHTRGLDSEQKCQQQESEVALGSRNAPHSHKGDSNMEVRVFTCTAHTQRPYLKDSTPRHHNQAQGHICVSRLV